MSNLLELPAGRRVAEMHSATTQVLRHLGFRASRLTKAGLANGQAIG